MKGSTELCIAASLSLIMILELFIFGCCSTQKFYDIPEYKKVIELKESANHEKYYETKLSICKFIRSKYESKNKDLNIPAKENRLRELVKSEGLYINSIEYKQDEFGDTYCFIEASEIPTFTEDWMEHKKHCELMELRRLQDKYSTNKVEKCNCRYCTSGLDRKYWY